MLATVQTTSCIDIYVACVTAVNADVRMIPHSKYDKEFFFQDWFEDRLKELTFAYQQSSRNKYPDFLVTEHTDEAYECKAMYTLPSGRPAHKKLDFNSSLPVGIRRGFNHFLVFAAYSGAGADSRKITTFHMVHCDFINYDVPWKLGAKKENETIGSCGDGQLRLRPMYKFPTPVSIDETGLGRHRLIVPSFWCLEDPRLQYIKTIPRALDDANKQLKPGEEIPMRRHVRDFEVFELAGND